MKQAYHFPAISHFCDVIAEEYGKDNVDTQLVLNSISMLSAQRLEFLLMKLHKEQNHNFVGLATGEGWDQEEMCELHPDMRKVWYFHEAIMSDDYRTFN